MTFYQRTLLILVCLTVFAGCTLAPPKAPQRAPAPYTGSAGYQPSFGVPEGTGTSVSIGQGEIIQAQQAQSQRAWVTVRAMVFRLLRDDTKPPCHQRFILKLDNGTTVEVAHNTDLAPHVPVSPGDSVTIHGEYIWNRKGGVLHWTHHDPQGTEPGGWIDFNGQRYR